MKHLIAIYPGGGPAWAGRNLTRLDSAVQPLLDEGLERCYMFPHLPDDDRNDVRSASDEKTARDGFSASGLDRDFEGHVAFNYEGPAFVKLIGGRAVSQPERRDAALFVLDNIRWLQRQFPKAQVGNYSTVQLRHYWARNTSSRWHGKVDEFTARMLLAGTPVSYLQCYPAQGHPEDIGNYVKWCRERTPEGNELIAMLSPMSYGTGGNFRVIDLAKRQEVIDRVRPYVDGYCHWVPVALERHRGITDEQMIEWAKEDVRAVRG